MDQEARISGLADLQSVTVATAASYSRTLDSQQASKKPLVLVLSADVAGNRAGAAFDWDRGDVLWFGPESVMAEFLFNIPAPGSGGDVDLSAYRKAADQDVIDRTLATKAQLGDYRTAAAEDIVNQRATDGILLARQEARPRPSRPPTAPPNTCLLYTSPSPRDS